VAFLLGIFAAKALHLHPVLRPLRDPYIAALALESGMLLVLSLLPRAPMS
jgi:hypothetical protein